MVAVVALGVVPASAQTRPHNVIMKDVSSAFSGLRKSVSAFIHRAKPLERFMLRVIDGQPALSSVLHGIDEVLARLLDDPRVLEPTRPSPANAPATVTPKAALADRPFGQPCGIDDPELLADLGLAVVRRSSGPSGRRHRVLATVDAADIRGLGTAQTVVRRGAASP